MNTKIYDYLPNDFIEESRDSDRINKYKKSVNDFIDNISEDKTKYIQNYIDSLVDGEEDGNSALSPQRRINKYYTLNDGVYNTSRIKNMKGKTIKVRQ